MGLSEEALLAAGCLPDLSKPLPRLMAQECISKEKCFSTGVIKPADENLFKKEKKRLFCFFNSGFILH